MEPVKRELIDLLNKNSVKTGKFTLSSGKESDFFIDCKQTILSARGHLAAGRCMLAVVRSLFTEADAVAGVELGGCPLASAVSVLSNTDGSGDGLPALYVRKSKKDHGTGQLVEGKGSVAPGSKVVLLEDVVTTGGSSMRAVEALGAEGFDVVGVVALVDREEGASEHFMEQEVPFVPILTRQELLEHR